MPPTQGQLVIISGPSGVGKSTVVAELVRQFAGKLRLSVSATTRTPRPGEIPGKHYHFLSHEEFEARRQQGEFLEAMEVFGRGHWYGTLLSEVRPSLAEGTWVILEIDVDGARNALQQFPQAISIFITVDSEAELERRLRERRTESEEAIRRRLEVARHELAEANSYHHIVVNHDIQATVDTIAEILKQEGLQS